MAGSRVWRSYTSDDGVAYLLNVDESKADAVVGSGGAALQAFQPGLGTIPKGVTKLRRVNVYNVANPVQKAVIKIGTLAIYNSIAAGTQIVEAAGDGTTAITWAVSSRRGEQSRLPVGVDTGLTDGDAT